MNFFRLIPLTSLNFSLIAGLAVAAPKIQVNRTEIEMGQIYVAPDSGRFIGWFHGPHENIIITNTGDAVLNADYGGTKISLLPGQSTSQQIKAFEVFMGPNTWTTSVTSNDPVTPTILIVTSYEGIEQPPLVLEKIDGTPIISGETVLHLDPVVWDPDSTHPTQIPRNTSVMIRARNTGVAHMPIYGNTLTNWSYGANIVGKSDIDLGGGITPDSFFYDTLLIPPMGTVDIEVILNPLSLGPIKTKIALSSYWSHSSNLRQPSVEFFVQTVATGFPRLAVSHGANQWSPSGIPPLEFDTKHIGEFQDSNILIKNEGRLPLTVTPEVIGGNQQDFVLWNPSPVTIPEGDSRSMPVRFRPTDGGPRSSTVRINSNDPDQPFFDVAVQGAGFRLVLEDPEGSGFGDLPLGTRSTRTFAIANKGLTGISGIAVDLTTTAGGQFELIGDIPYQLPPGGRTEFTVRFSPTQAGTKFTSLKLTTLENLANPLLLAISGTGTPAASLVIVGEKGQTLAAGGANLNVPYDSVDMGDYKRFAYDLKNEGTIPLTISGAFMPGGNKDFSLLAPLPDSVKPGGTARFEITFRPADTGSRAAVFRIQSNDPDQPEVLITLTGSGFPFTVESPEGTDFDTTPVGETEVLNFVLVNNGSTSLTGISAILSSDGAAAPLRIKPGGGSTEFTLASSIPKSLAPKQRLKFKVNFKPKSAGKRNVRLLLRSSKNRNEPLALRLTGNAVRAPGISVSNASGKSLKSDVSLESFGKVPVGETSVREFSIKNTGTAALKVSKISTRGADAGIFTILGAPGKPLLPGKSAKLRILCKPVNAGTFSASVSIRSNDMDEKVFTFKLSGKATSSPVKPNDRNSKSDSATAADAETLEAITYRSVTRVDGEKFRTLTVTNPQSGGRKAIIEVSSDHVRWQSGKSHTVVLRSGPALLKVRDATPFTAEQKRFIRVRFIKAD